MYRSMVHVGHAASVATLCSLSVPFGANVRLHYRHTSNLPQGRALWLRECLAMKADYAITLDSDTEFLASVLLKELDDTKNIPWAIGIAPVVRKRGEGIALNIYSGQGEAISPPTCGGGRPPLWAGGFGLAVFNLSWFANHWPLPYPEPFGDREEWISQGEDIQFCRSVVSRNGRIIPLWVPTAHYDGANDMIIGGRLSYSGGRMTALVSEVAE